MSAHPTDIPTVEGLRNILKALRSGLFGQREVWEQHLTEAISCLTPPLPPMQVPPTNYSEAMGVILGMRAEIQRLTTPPLPQEIVGLIEELSDFLTMEDHPGDVAFLDAIEKAANALRAQAQENERVTNELATLVAEFNARGMERDGLRAKCATLEEHIRELKAERDAKVP